MRMLITLLMPTAGSATVAGFDVVSEANEVRLRIGAALQEAALDLKQTGRELLRLQGRLYGLNRRELDTRPGRSWRDWWISATRSTALSAPTQAA